MDGTLVVVGLPPEQLQLSAGNVAHGPKAVVGSTIGDIKENQQMLDLCTSQQITAEIERLSIQKVNEAFERLAKGDVRYRFVVDMQSLSAS